MKDRGKREVEAYNNGEYYGENIPEFPCKKHPASASSSAGGICAYCLTDRLAQLVCPQCGEQRLSSCACSCSAEIFSNPNNSSISDVGRISFLLENDQRGAEISGSKPKHEQRSSNYTNINNNNNNDEFNTNLRRSSSISAAATDVINKGKKSETGKLWKIGRLFRKKRDKGNNPNKSSSNNNNNNNNNNNVNEENYDCNGVSRSRSLCSFRGFYDPEESGGFPGSISAARASSVSTGNFMLDSAKRSCFSESEARISNFDYYDASNFVGPNKNNNNNNNIFSLKETEFVSCDDPAFIDLKLNESNNNNNNYNYNNYSSSSNNNMMSSSDYSYSRVPDLAAMRRSGLGLSTKEYGYRGGGHDLMGHEMFKNGGASCRISDVSERDLRKCRKSYKVWKWFSKHHTSSSSKYDDHDFKS